jgi:hypothetical protein
MILLVTTLLPLFGQEEKGRVTKGREIFSAIGHLIVSHFGYYILLVQCFKMIETVC